MTAAIPGLIVRLGRDHAVVLGASRHSVVLAPIIRAGADNQRRGDVRITALPDNPYPVVRCSAAFVVGAGVAFQEIGLVGCLSALRMAAARAAEAEAEGR